MEVRRELEDGPDFRLVILLGFVAFSGSNYLAGFLVPESATKTDQQRWKWKNVATSLFHSVITGIWSPIVFYQAPGMSEDLIHSVDASSHSLISFSIGYFIYDALDMLLHHRKRSSYELLIHHFLVILCFSIAATTGKYVAYAALALMVEVNSVFLHARQLFIITGEPKSSLRYKCNALLNVGTFLFFRILLLGWMTRWLTVHRNIIPLAFFTVGSIGLAIIVLMNIILFCRILSVDFSSILRAGGKSADHRKEEFSSQKLNGNANWSHTSINTYVKSVFEEEPPTEGRERKD